MKRAGIDSPSHAWGQCAIESFDLAKKRGYGLVRVTGMAYRGREHWACLTGDLAVMEDMKVIDLTARQFSIKVPARYEVDLDTWLDDACEWLGDSLNYEIYTQMDDYREPYFTDFWLRDDIDPDTFVREEAWLTAGVTA